MRRQSEQRRRSVRRRAVYGVMAIAVMVVVGLVLAPRTVSSPKSTTVREGPVAGAVVRRETRPTLDPALFTGKAALAYQVARDIPDVLDQLSCHCACGQQYGHVS